MAKKGQKTQKAEWKHSYTHLPIIVGEMDGVPIKDYGRIYIFGVSPDFETGVLLQQGNRTKTTKIVPKRPWEITENNMGTHWSYPPRSPQSDFQPFLAVHLIDGDPLTCWATRGDAQPDVSPAWARLDLPAEERVTKIVLIPRKDGHPWPGELTIKVSRDAWHWETVYDSKGEAPPAGEPVQVEFAELVSAKQIWIIANQLPPDKSTQFGSSGDHTFSLAGIQAFDEKDENVALISRGVGVTVSSTNYGWASSWDYLDRVWPVLNDMGAKWIRTSAGHFPWPTDTLQWQFVERERGKYVIDTKTDAVISELADNGYHVLLQLVYGNYLYSSEPEKAKLYLDKHAFPIPDPPAPLNRDAFEGYKNWARFMVNHFKGRVRCWEIWNEAPWWGYGSVESWEEKVKLYCDLVKEVVPVIREEDPHAIISLAGMGGVPGEEFRGKVESDFLRDCLAYGLAPLVDVIGWHIQGNVHPDLKGWEQYPKVVRDFKRDAEASGFKGIYMVTEYWEGDPYPPNPGWGYPPHTDQRLGEIYITEMRKAKDVARTHIMNLGLGLISYYINLWIEDIQNGNGLLRNTFASEPYSPLQPSAGYYAMRTICTVMEGAEPSEKAVDFSHKAQRFEHWSFTQSGTDLVGIWLPGASMDKHPGVTTDVVIEADKCKRVIGIDILNGFEQELKFEHKDGKVVIPQVIVRDYPLMLRLEI